jgi:hypothetical protein
MRGGRGGKGQGLLSGVSLTERRLFLLGLGDSDWAGSNKSNLIATGWSKRLPFFDNFLSLWYYKSYGIMIFVIL